MDLFLFTNFFPYKKSEPFLVNEFEFAKEHFSRIHVFPLYGTKNESILKDHPGIDLFPPLLGSPASKKALFFNGILNFSRFNFHLQEFISKKVFRSATKSYWFFISLLMTRTAL